MSTILKALEIACKAHEGQFDKAGKPYIQHPVRVALYCETEDEKIVALLHDVIEDTSVTISDLRAEGFSEKILDAIEHLTKIEGENYQDFIQRVAENNLATKVKIQDLTDNMDLSRLGDVKVHWKMETYKQALSFLKAGTIKVF